MNVDDSKLGLECYGYGRWSAPYWFIGLEEGQNKSAHDDLNLRHQVLDEFSKNGSNVRGLCDIAEFHGHPNLSSEKKWFEGAKPPTQETWRSLILLLKAYLNEDTGLESRRIYQRDRCGRSGPDGETCLIELSGLAANNSRIARDRKSYLDDRITFIRSQLANSSPKLVVMYGKSAKAHWGKIAAVPLELDVPCQIGSTTFLSVLHPTDFFEKGKKKNDYYAALGAKLREEAVGFATRN